MILATAAAGEMKSTHRLETAWPLPLPTKTRYLVGLLKGAPSTQATTGSMLAEPID